MDMEMEKEKDLGLLYLLFQDDEIGKQELIDILLDMQVEVESIPRIQELTLWMKSPDKQRPSLLITDISPTDRTFQALRNRLQGAFIINIHEDAVNEEDHENGNIIITMKTIESVKSYLVNESNIDDEFITRVHTKPPNSLDNEPENSQLYHIGDGPFHEEINPALKDIAEYREDTADNEFDYAPPQSMAIYDDLVPPSDIEQDVVSDDNINDQLDSSDPKAPVDSVTPYYQRSRNIQNEFMNRDIETENSTIGIWSPIPRMGVTSFAINFAFFLKSNRVDTAVLEGLTGKYALKDWLKRYTRVPENWTSYAEAIQTDSDIKSTIWKYRDVMFLPLDKKDSHYEWSNLALDFYMKTTSKIFDVTLVDFPTGEMGEHTIYSLERCSELWIMVDDAIQETIAWKAYIMTIKKNLDIPIYMVFNKEYPFSQTKRLENEMGISLLTSIPSLHEETMRNYYEKDPVYSNESVQLKMNVPFTDLATHLFKGQFTPVEEKTAPEDQSWFKKHFRLMPKK